MPTNREPPFVAEVRDLRDRVAEVADEARNFLQRLAILESRLKKVRAVASPKPETIEALVACTVALVELRLELVPLLDLNERIDEIRQTVEGIERLVEERDTSSA